MKGAKAENIKWLKRENPISDKFFDLIKEQGDNVSARAIKPNKEKI